MHKIFQTGSRAIEKLVMILNRAQFKVKPQQVKIKGTYGGIFLSSSG